MPVSGSGPVYPISVESTRLSWGAPSAAVEANRRSAKRPRSHDNISSITAPPRTCVSTQTAILAERDLFEERQNGERVDFGDDIVSLMALQDPLDSFAVSGIPSGALGAQTGYGASGCPLASASDNRRGIATVRVSNEAEFPSDDFHAWLECFETRLPVTVSELMPADEAGVQSWSEPELHASAQTTDKAQHLWPRRPHRTAPLIHTLWHEVVRCTDKNLLSDADRVQELCQSGSLGVIGRDIATSIFEKLRPLMADSLDCTCAMNNKLFQDGCSPPDHLFNQAEGQCNACKVASELMVLGLEQYKRKFHAIIPIVHIPTFSPEETSSSLLMTMCLIGLTFVNTEEAATLLSRTFPGALALVYSEVVANAFGNVSAEKRMRMFATSGLMLALTILTGGNMYPDHSRLLYVMTLTAARQHGLFSANYYNALDASSAGLITNHRHGWIPWSRVESTKRIIICLMLADVWFSEYFSVGPIISTEYVQILLPCDNTLFHAPTANQWAQLSGHNRRASTLRFVLSSTDSQLPTLQQPVDKYSMKAILCSLLLRIYDRYYNLFSGVDAETLVRNQYIPWKVFAQDKSASANIGLALQIMQLYGNMMKDIASDCLVIWHQIGMSLTTDCYFLEEAVGRDGTEAARKAIARVKVWANTPAARRACLHASQAFKVISNRRPEDGRSFQSPNQLFNAALILGLYVLTAPAHSEDQTGCSDQFELLGEVDWKLIGAEGLVDVEARFAATTNIPAVNFIRFGGPISMNNEPCQGGVRSAQRILMDFASLLDDMKKWKIGDFSRLLYAISENLGQLHTAVLQI